MDVAAIRRYARVRRNDIVAAAVAAVGVLAFGPLYGLLLAVAGSVLGLVYRSSRVDVEVMGKVPHEKAAWGGIRNHEDRRMFPGVLVLRVDAPIFWVTAAPVHDVVLSKVEAAPDTRALVLDMEATNQIGHDERRHARRAPRRATTARYRPLPGPCHVAGTPTAPPVRADGRARRDHLWHSISQGVREARRAHGLKHLPATAGAADVPGEELLGEDTAEEEHIVARSPTPVRPSDIGDGPPGEGASRVSRLVRPVQALRWL